MSVALFAAGGVAITLLAEALHDDRRRAEASQQWLSGVLTSIGDAVIATDARGVVTFLNPVARTLTGWELENAVGKPLADIFRIVAEDSHSPVENPVDRVLRENIVVGLANHTVLIAKDGTERPIDDSGAPIMLENGKITGVVLVFRDVTHRRGAEAVQARLAAIVESSDDAIVGTRLDGVITSWNAGAQRIFGYVDEEIVGRSIDVLVSADRRDEVVELLAKLQRGEQINQFESVQITKDGRSIDVSLTLSPIRNSSGRIIGASKIARDITERRRLEQELQRRLAELAEADRRKDEFLAMLAHELRNPLAAFSSAAQLTTRTVDPDELEWCASVINRQINHLTRLIDEDGNPRAFGDMLDCMYHGGKIAMLGIMPRGAGIDWDKVIFKGLTLQGIYGRRMYETWYKMTQMVLTGFPLQKVLTHQIAIDDFQKGFDLMDAGQCGKVVCSWT